MRILSTKFFQALALLAAVGFVFGLLGRSNWNFDLFSHFRMQYAVVLLASGAAALAQRGGLLSGRIHGRGAGHLSAPAKSPAPNRRENVEIDQL